MEKPGDTHELSIDPGRRQLTALQAQRLGAISGVDAKELTGMVHADVAEKFRWRIDHDLFLMRRICGQVVRRDPVTGEDLPVPFATVHVEDTDSSLVGFFPAGWHWGWYFPFYSHREEIATVTTDECGRFCVWIPRFDIDWILRWRAERICFPDIFIRPSLEDLLDDFVDGPWPPIKFPDKGDPSPIEKLRVLGEIGRERLAAHVGGPLADRVSTAVRRVAFGAPAGESASLASRRAFDAEIPPPLPAELRPLGLEDVSESKDVREEKWNVRFAAAAPFSYDAFRAGISARLNIDPRMLARLDPRRFIGPFRRCFTYFVPEWTILHDVPDITFRVTQDVNGDGVEETIYSEGFFDVRWDAGAIPDVTLLASPIAIATRDCESPIVRCGNAPEIQFAGLMPLSNLPSPAAPYFDVASGYARRPNRPHPSGNPGDPPGDPDLTTTPFTRTLQLYGCAEVPGASFYRLKYSYNGGAEVPFVGLSWNLYRMVAGALQVHPVSADGAGWYPIVHSADNWHPHDMLLEWPTGAEGEYEITLELGDAAKNPRPATHTVSIRVDNTAPNVTYQTLRWKFAAEGDAGFFLAGRNLLGVCPTIRRGTVPADIDILMEVQVSATHLRDCSIGASGCELNALPFVPLTAYHAAHWHTDALDNTELLFARYRIPAVAREGAYSFSANGNSRAFNPAGSDGGHSSDWNYDVVYNYSPTSVHVAVVDAT